MTMLTRSGEKSFGTLVTAIRYKRYINLKLGARKYITPMLGASCADIVE